MNIVVIDSGKNHQWILKLEDESLMRKKSSLKICPHKLLINYKGKFTVWKSARHHLNQANKVNRNDNGTNYYCLPSSAIL